MKALFVMPVVNEEITDGCIATIDTQFYSDLYIIDNSSDGFAKKYEVGFYAPRPENIGVGRAWNLGAKKVINEGYDYLVIISATMRFGDGMRGFVKALETNLNPWGLETQHGWHCIALHRNTLQKVGLFDENFYPAYYEDSDYVRRMELAGIHNPMSNLQRLPKVDIIAGFVGNAHGMRKGKIRVNMGACRQYFIDKWGYEPRYENQRFRDILFQWPFNDPRNGLDYWPVKDIEELKEKYDLFDYRVTFQSGDENKTLYAGQNKEEATNLFKSYNETGRIYLYRDEILLDHRKIKVKDNEDRAFSV